MIDKCEQLKHDNEQLRASIKRQRFPGSPVRATCCLFSLSTDTRRPLSKVGIRGGQESD